MHGCAVRDALRPEIGFAGLQAKHDLCVSSEEGRGRRGNMSSPAQNDRGEGRHPPLILAPPTPHCGASVFRRRTPLRPDLPSPVRHATANVRVRRPVVREVCLTSGRHRCRCGPRALDGRELARCQRHAPAKQVLLVQSVPTLRRERLDEPRAPRVQLGELPGLSSGLPRLAPLRGVLRRRRRLGRMSRRDDEEAKNEE
jgi:hypothetical protein